MKLSKITIAYGLYIIISASFIQQVWKFLGEAAGEGNVKRGGIFLFCTLSFFILRRIVKFHFSAARLIVNVIILFVAFAFAWSKPIFVEKMHVIEYGILGWLVTRDFSKDRAAFKSIVASLIFILIIGSLDEFFQKILPYRVGEVRDVVINIISGAFGVILYLSAFAENPAHGRG